MIKLSYSQFQNAIGCNFQTAAIWSEYMTAAMDRFDINTPNRIADFLAHVGHESTGLTQLVENLNYSADALRRVSPWNTRMTAEQARLYGRIEERGKVIQLANKRMIAEIGYGGRMGNGPAGSGDAFRTIGRGPIQISGTDNYIRCGHMLGTDLFAAPTLLEGPRLGSLSAAWFWASGNSSGKSLNALSDAGKFDTMSDIINIGRPTAKVGDANGYADRLARRDRILQAIA